MSPTLVSPRFTSLAFLLALAGALQAQTVVYNNLVTSGNTVQTWNLLTKVGQSFTPNASGTISSFTLNLTTTNGTATPVYTVELWSDNGAATHLPSGLLATFVSGQPWISLYSGSAVHNAANTVTFSSGSFSQNYSVNVGTAYWLVITSSGGAAKAWGVGSDTDNPFATFAGSTWSTGAAAGGGNLGAQISVNGSAIPEPGTYAAFAGLAVLGFAGYSRRRAAGAKQARGAPGLRTNP